MLEGTVTNAICLNLEKKWVKGIEGESRKKRYDKKVDYKFPCL